MRRIVYLCAGLIALPGIVLAACPVGTKSAADQITGHMNAVYGDVQTYCVPSNDPAGCSIVCFTASRITSYHAMSERLAASVGAVEQLTDRVRPQFDYLHMADRGLLEQRLTLRIPTPRALDAQSQGTELTDDDRRSADTVWERFALHSLPSLTDPPLR